MLDYIGADNIMWSSDYPHGVTTWPRSRDVIEKNLGKRSGEEREKILSANARRPLRHELGTRSRSATRRARQ